MRTGLALGAFVAPWDSSRAEEVAEILALWVCNNTAAGKRRVGGSPRALCNRVLHLQARNNASTESRSAEG